MRNLSEVIDQMLELIPKEEESLISSLEDIKNSLEFCAPENVITFWHLTAENLREECRVNPRGMEWIVTVINIFNGDSEK